eukprot:TRINITY_DN25124_c0_g1_i1.p1 TRINITY_DN25124_c0_g1~~TRINITY_DN25124_c0_g1_i1.p1  ORF type:complete len:727 (-),score=211.64 TRINITY_DN25124_c0_g1_i1:271-2451(-)
MDASLRVSPDDLDATLLGRVWQEVPEEERGDWKEDLSCLVEGWLEECVESAAAHSLVADDVVEQPSVLSGFGEASPQASDQVSEAASSPGFGERLGRAVPALGVRMRMAWRRLAAVQSVDEMDVEESMLSDSSPATARCGSRSASRKGKCVEVNSGGQVFFGILSSAENGSKQEEGIVFKFCNARHRRQSEQMAAELAWHLGVNAPASRLLLRVHDSEEWQELKEAAGAAGCAELQELLGVKQSLLVMQFVPSCNLQDEKAAWGEDSLVSSAEALGRLLVLDMLLGNADRLPIRSLSWRGNPSNVLWTSAPVALYGKAPAAEVCTSRQCVPIDALLARRPPKQLVKAEEQRVGKLLEMMLLDAPSAQEVLLEAVGCNNAAVQAFEANRAAKQQRQRAGSKVSQNSSAEQRTALKGFHDGIRLALAAAAQEQNIIDMLVQVMKSWFETFHKDMQQIRGIDGLKHQTLTLKALSSEADKNSEVRERWSSWQSLIQEKSAQLHAAAEAWAIERELPVPFSFKGFLGATVVNPLIDTYELLIRLEHLAARIRVMANAGAATKPADLAPSPLMVGPATSAGCFHVMRKLGVTCILNCTKDLLEPEKADLGEDIAWHRLALADVESQDLQAAFEEGLRIIDQAVAKGGKVLVHCHEGRSRSVSMCLAYMMTREKKTFADAMNFVKSKRPQARPNAGFWKQLVALELATHGSSTAEQLEAPKGKPVLTSSLRE